MRLGPRRQQCCGFCSWILGIIASQNCYCGNRPLRSKSAFPACSHLVTECKVLGATRGWSCPSSEWVLSAGHLCDHIFIFPICDTRMRMRAALLECFSCTHSSVPLGSFLPCPVPIKVQQHTDQDLLDSPYREVSMFNTLLRVFGVTQHFDALKLLCTHRTVMVMTAGSQCPLPTSRCCLSPPASPGRWGSLNSGCQLLALCSELTLQPATQQGDHPLPTQQLVPILMPPSSQLQASAMHPQVAQKQSCSHCPAIPEAVWDGNEP